MEESNTKKGKIKFPYVLFYIAIGFGIIGSAISDDYLSKIGLDNWYFLVIGLIIMAIAFAKVIIQIYKNKKK